MRTGGVVGNQCRPVLLSAMRSRTGSATGVPFGVEGTCCPKPTDAGGWREAGTSLVLAMMGLPNRSMSKRLVEVALFCASAAKTAPAHSSEITTLNQSQQYR